ncbi:LSU ribosomal protein L10P [Candidatus Kryptonium thompsonii]|uniref:Large ribosomal subunit protein uL10 n=1 Tax=Candidatus Kryptonium thompsonii TaxID=1633631 RepID=A0A0P1M2Z5_9BACT|nr:50S ribosomal protein L10 [Candidatus Kryptonium thompsoni]CUS78717.1 LSU ribosomal protein L10P [Candidatus Kryptonium thompsoni]CUS81109.1 LSU ribosomal protein L10P [Candidatus Kryptonium thompsoni]CUS86694.1 LSU ribosomal protein L10P [Candidatus Kryptonium thompsoni]CUS88578.1 LSU ribosomal protein L10P [Candidatus Kryptonium thompsoni]CUS89081.1 LSU ribosomal protein L10P [Candidatus Kryptonium thompsoni]
MKKEEKSKIIEEISEKISKSKGLVLADFTRMTVAEVNELRRELKSAGVDYKVVKNTLLKIAMQNVGGYDGLFKYLEGPTAVAFGYDDPITPVRLIKKIKGKIEKPSVKAIFIEGQVYDGSKLDELANLPSKSDIIAGIIGSVIAPASGIVWTLNAVLSELVLVIDAIAKKLEEKGS